MQHQNIVQKQFLTCIFRHIDLYFDLTVLHVLLYLRTKSILPIYNQHILRGDLLFSLSYRYKLAIEYWYRYNTAS